uniref:Ankyrin repeat and EF-hand domain containing 1a n=1 Tax=Salarias fasciatus TaxID=181472 RepID=A0A672HHS3_SALFA
MSKLSRTTINVAQGRLQVLQVYRLLQCVREADREQIEKMVKLGVDGLINLTEPEDGMGPLHMAVSLVSFLLSHGAHPNIQDRKGRTPVMLAAQLGSDTIVNLLIQNQADLLLQDAEGKGVLFYCIYPTKRHFRCLQAALSSRADPNNVSAEGTHVFQVACEKALECTPMCLVMLHGGADPNAANQKTGVTVLMEAARAGSLQLVRAILQRGGNPNALDQRHLSAVHYAAMGGFFEVIQVLSAYSAAMSIINLDKCTPLHYAAASGNANCCKFLAQRGCNPKLKNQEGLLPRQIAKDSGHKAAAKELRKAERQHGKGKKPSGAGPMSDVWALTLHDWSHENQAELRQAFGNGSDIITTEMFISVLEGLKAPVEPEQLHLVVTAHDKRREGCVNINEFFKGVKYIKKPFLLASYVPKKKKGAKGAKGGKKKKKKEKFALPICTLPPELMARRADGGPPHFMIEKFCHCSDVNRFGSDRPPDHPIVNDSGWYMEKPDRAYINISHCVRNEDLQSLDLAFSQGVPVDVQDEFYKTPLMVACSSGNYEVVQYLLSKGASVNTCDQFFWTPLHHAASSGHVEIVELLVAAGATVNGQALSGGTPLMRAIESSQSSCVDFLIKAGASVNAENKRGQNCLDIARAFADSRIIDLVKNKMDSLPKPKDAVKGRGDKTQKPKSSMTAGQTPLQKDSKGIIQQNARITTGQANAVDISFVPKTVWGKPATTSQLMSKIEKRKGPLSLEVDLDDFMMPFSQSIQRKILAMKDSTG